MGGKKVDILALLIYAIAVISMTFPLVLQIHKITTGFGDELLIAWIHAWNIHSLQATIGEVFHANIFYPYLNTLAYSDTFFTSSLLSFIPVKLLGEPIVANNFTILTSLIGNGFGVYVLTKYLTKNTLASFVSGLLVLFSPVVLDKIVHIQMLTVYFVPIAILYLFRFLDTKNVRYFVIFAAALVLQVYNSFLPGFFIVFSSVIICAVLFRKKKKLPIVSPKPLFVLFLSIVLIIPITLPYFSVSREFRYVRDIREVIHYSLHPMDLLYPNDFTRLKPLLLSFQQSPLPSIDFKPGYVGFVFSSLIIVSLLFFLKRLKTLDYKATGILLSAWLGFCMSFGPFFHIFRDTVKEPFPIPLPYLLFYYLIPGFQGIRNVARWEILFVLLIAVIIGLFLHRISRSLSKDKYILLYAVVIVGIISEFSFPISFRPLVSTSEFPPVYHWIHTLPKDSIIIEMPIYNWNMFPYGRIELMRNYFSTAHFRRSVNGASGFSPPPWQDMAVRLTQSFPNTASYDMLSELGVNYVVVHLDEYARLSKAKFSVNGTSAKNAETVIREIDESNRYDLVKEFPGTRVYTLKAR